MAITGVKDGPVTGDRKLIQQWLDLIEAGPHDNYAPLLPVFFKVMGKPYRIDDFVQFEEMFSTAQPARMTLKTARQCGKSYFICALGASLSVLTPNPLRLMYVAPLQSQIERLSGQVLTPLIDHSPVRSMFFNPKTCKEGIRYRSFPNQSTMNFGFASKDMERLRGYSADILFFDEYQDFNPVFIPVIEYILSASEYEMARQAGTPKTMNNPIEIEWRKSSQAEWFIKCDNGECNNPRRNHGWNIPSLEYHLMQMIGPVLDTIGPEIEGGDAGLVCRWCQKPLRPGKMLHKGEKFVCGYHGNGVWVHRNDGHTADGYVAERDLRHRRTGYHISQPILKHHYSNRDKWQKLVLDRDNRAPATFQNESLGESCDAGAALFTADILKRACTLEINGQRIANDPIMGPGEEVMRKIMKHDMRVLGVDWGGGGEDETSWTKMALCCYDRDMKGSVIKVYWGKMLNTPHDPLGEAKQVAKWFRKFRCTHLACDYTGAGKERAAYLTGLYKKVGTGNAAQRHYLVPHRLLFNVRYCGPTKQAMMIPENPSNRHPFQIFSVDKTASLVTLSIQIRRARIRFFEYDNENPERPGLMGDFLNLVPEMTGGYISPEKYIIRKQDQTSDDFAHAVNIGSCCIWWVKKCLPKI
jgi:hypothetical protein